MLSLLMVLAVWVALSVVAAAGFCLVLLGARSHAERRLTAVPAQRRAAAERTAADRTAADRTAADRTAALV